MTKRILSLLLVLALAFTVLPQTALMAEPVCAHENTVSSTLTFGGTRGEFVYMLWLIAGRPEPAVTNSFTDISESDYFYKAAHWAVEQGITAGFSASTFNPDPILNRGQAVTFLWRYAGSPEPTLKQSPFRDVTTDHYYYYKAVLWAAETDWIDLSASSVYFKPENSAGEFYLDASACEDCGEIIAVSKVTFSGYSAKGTYGKNLEWKIKDGTLIISGSGEMMGLADGERAPWFDYQNEIMHLSLPEGLTTIGDYAFAYLPYISHVDIPESVTEIAAFAFYGSSAIMSLTIPDSVTNIGEGAFASCQLLMKPKLPKNLKHLGYGVFIDTAFSNEERNWNNGILYLDGWIVDSDGDISEANIRAGTKGICDLAFAENAELKRVTIPDSVMIIGDCAFAATSIKSVTIPDSVTDFGDGIFIECPLLKDVKISNSVAIIKPCAFSFCERLNKIEIPSSVERIGEYAFYGCNNLKSITIANRDCEIIEGEEPEFMLGDPEVTTICGYKGSPAETYAKKYGYTFVELNDKVPFVDVPAKAFYSEPVVWAVENKITNGVDSTHFGPDATCNRGQVVTFLWRAAGSPEPASIQTVFADVNETAFYAKAVAWAGENRITSGTAPTAFSPAQGCTRGQVVTFLWRAAGCPEPESTDNPFTDVKEGAFYYKAVLWAVENGITNGTGKTTFSPNTTCTRGQIVTFLYRAVEDK